MRITFSLPILVLIALSLVAGIAWGWKCGIFVFAVPFILDLAEKIK